MRRDDRRIEICVVLASIAWSGCAGAPEEEPATAMGPIFTDIAEASGISHRHHKPVLDPKLGHIMPWMASVGAAVAAGDYDRDGRIDLYVTSSRKGEPNRLYRNDGVGGGGAIAFTDVAAAAGLAAVKVREALARWEPRTEVIEVDATPDPERRNLLLIEVTYRIRRNQQTANLVFPFFLEDGAAETRG